MPGGVWVFGPEGGSESVDVTHRTGVVFGGQLTTNGEEGWLFEEIFGVVDHFWGLVLGDFRNWLLLFGEDGGDLEHGSSPLTVTRSDQGSAYVDEASVLVEEMGGQQNWVSDAHNRTDQVGARP